MKKFVCFICILLISLPFWAFSETIPTVVIEKGFSLSEIFDYLVTNWVSISLIISEIAALLSSRWSGILKALINVLDYIINKKKGSSGSLLKGWRSTDK